MVIKKSHRYWTIVFLLSISSVCFSQTTPDVQRLEPGKPIERELDGGGFHVYTIHLRAEQFMTLVVDQRGIDVVLTLFAPDGKQVMDVDSPNGKNGPERLSFIAISTGPYKLQVRSLEKKTSIGHYEVRVDGLRPATTEEKLELASIQFAALLASTKTEAERTSLLAANKTAVNIELIRALDNQAQELGNRRNLGQAAAIDQLALHLAEQLDDKTGQGDALYAMGWVRLQQDDPSRALAHVQRSLVLREALGDKLKIANSLNLMAIGHQHQRKFTEALDYYEKALAIYETISQKESIARIAVSIAGLHQAKGNNALALEAFQRGLPAIEATGNKNMLATTFINLGWTNFNLGNYPPALEHYRKGLKISEESGNKSQVAEILNRISLVLRLQGDFTQAFEHASKALEIVESINNTPLMAHIQMTLGLIYASQSDAKSALVSFQKSLELAEQTKLKPMIANALEKIGETYNRQGEISKARDYLQRSLRLNEELGDKRQISFSLVTLGEFHRFQGNYSQALELFHRSLTLNEELANKAQIAAALNKIGIVHFYQGNYVQALDYFQKGLTMREAIGNTGGIIDSLNNIGEVQRVQGNFPLAIEFYKRSLQFSEKIKSKGGKRDALNNLGQVYRLMGDYPQAMDFSRQSLALSEELGHRLAIPESLTLMANIYAAQGEHQQAVDFARRAVEMARETGTRYQVLEGLMSLAKSFRSLKQTSQSRQALEESLETIESSRMLIDGQQSRANFFATVQQTYELYIDLLMQEHKQNPKAGLDGSAFQVNERSRARSLLETLIEARADIRVGVEPTLLEQGRSLQQQLNARAERQMKLLSEHTEEQAAALQKEIDWLTTGYQRVEAQIRQSSPRYAALTQPQPLTLSEIQKDLLDAETALLEYALGEERSYLWVVTPTSIMSAELPKRAELESTGRRLIEMLSDGKGWATGATVNTEYAAVASELSETLLPASILSHLRVKRLVIVADGVLQYVPFAALPTVKLKQSKSSLEQTQSKRPLIADYEIVNLPSASTLAVLRRETASRIRGTKSVAILADPVFDKMDERVTAMNTTTGLAANAELMSSVRTATVEATSDLRTLLMERALQFNTNTELTGSPREPLRIGRLPFTRFEAENILAATTSNQSLKATDFRANRETATSPELAQYRFVHFATHAILNSEHPELSGIVLSLVDEQGKPVDGFLRLHDIYNLNLPADLVVLSACQTGLGREIRGEGLLGLTRGFMYAGAPRVVASLWKVDDAATAELMKRFYAAMLKDNLRPAAALRRAKVEMWKQKRWQAPFYWAAFELQGEWR